MSSQETIGSMAATERWAQRNGRRFVNGKRVPVRYMHALEIYQRNVKSHPEVARMTYADAVDAGI